MVLRQNVASSNVNISNVNASETKANESFDINVFFGIEAKRTPSTVSNYFRSKANTFDKIKIIFEAKRTHSIVRKLFSKRSEQSRH
jgi:hypothetical protein